MNPKKIIVQMLIMMIHKKNFRKNKPINIHIINNIKIFYLSIHESPEKKNSNGW